MAGQRIKSGAVEVEGLVELNRAINKLGPEFKGEMRRTNKTVADIVAEDSRSAASSLGSTAAHVLPSIKSTAGALSAGVSIGGNAYPEASGAEFGSQKFTQFQPWRGTGDSAGYFLFPTIRRDTDRIAVEYDAAAGRLIKKVGLA